MSLSRELFVVPILRHSFGRPSQEMVVLGCCGAKRQMCLTNLSHLRIDVKQTLIRGAVWPLGAHCCHLADVEILG